MLSHFCEFSRADSLLCLEVKFPCSHPCGFYTVSKSSSADSTKSGGRRYDRDTPLRGENFTVSYFHHLDQMWVCVNHLLQQTEASLMRVERDSLINECKLLGIFLALCSLTRIMAGDSSEGL